MKLLKINKKKVAMGFVPIATFFLIILRINIINSQY